MYVALFAAVCAAGVGEPVIKTPAPGGPVPQARLEAFDMDHDRAGTNHAFGPGSGSIFIFPYANDLHFRVSVGLPRAAALVRASLSHTMRGEAWTTFNDKTYPLVVYVDGKQVNRAYVEPVAQLPAGNTVLDLYAQLESQPFSGGVLALAFSDGSKVDLTLPAESPEMPVSAPLDGANMWLYELEARPPSVDAKDNRKWWKWKVMLGLANRQQVRAVRLTGLDGTVWAAGSKSPASARPLLVFHQGPGKEYLRNENTAGTAWPLKEPAVALQGPQLFMLYGERPKGTFPGARLQVEFVDGTSIETSMPALPWPR
jgi:hypothetical protein